MNRRDFLLKAYRIGGLTALLSLGVARSEAAVMVGFGSAPAGCAGGSDGAIGSSAQSTASALATGGYIQYFPFTPTNDGDVTYMHCSVYATNGSTVRMGIYNASGTLLGSTGNVTTDATDPQHIHAALSAAVCLASATTYYLAVWVNSSSASSVYRSAWTGNEIKGEAAASFPASVTIPGAQSAYGYDLKVTANNSASAF